MSWLNTDAAFMLANQNNVALLRPLNDGTMSRTLTILEINETYIEYMFFLNCFLFIFYFFVLIHSALLTILLCFVWFHISKSSCRQEEESWAD